MSTQVLQILINGQDRTQEVFRGLQTNVKGLKEKLDSLGQSMQRAGGDLTKGFTVPLAALAAGSAKAAISFESAFAGVRKTVDATEAQFKKLNDGFREMAKTIPISAVELAKIGEAAGQLGIRQESVLGFTKVMAELGVTTNLSAEEAASSLAQLANITGMSHDQFDRLGAAVVALGNDGASTEKQIVEMGLRIAGAGEQVGLAEHQILAIGAALANVGIEAEAGGTAISRTLKEMQVSVSRGGESLQQFANVAGVSAARFREMFAADAASTLNTFIVGLNKMKLQGQDVISVLDEMGITEIRQSDALLRLAGSADQVTKALKVSADGWRANTALTKEATERFKTTESQLKLLWNRIVDVGITLGNALLPHIRAAVISFEALIPKIDGAAKWFATLDPLIQRAGIGFLGLVALSGPMLYFLGSMAGAIANLVGLFKSLIALQIGSWFVALGNTIPILTARLYLLQIGFTSFWLAAGAVGAAAAIGVGIGSLIRDMTSLGKTLDELADKWSGLAEAQARAAGQNASVNASGKGAQGVSLGQRFADMGWTPAQIQQYMKFVDTVKKGSADVVKAHEQRVTRTRVLTDEEKKIIEQHANKIRDLMNKMSGRDLQTQVNDISEAIQRMGGASRISEAELRRLGPQLEEAARQGARLPRHAEAALLAYRRLADLIPNLALGLRALTPIPGGGAGNVNVTDDGVDRRLLRPPTPASVHLTTLVERAPTLMERITAGWNGLTEQMQRDLRGLADYAAGLFTEFGGRVGSTLGPIIQGFLSGGNVGGITAFFNTMISGAQALARRIKEANTEIKNTRQSLLDAHGGMRGLEREAGRLGVSMHLVTQAMARLGPGMEQIQAHALRQLREEMDRLAEQAERRMEGISNGIAGLTTYVTGLVAQMGRGMTDELRAAFTRAGDYAAALFGQLIRETGNVIAAIRQMKDVLEELRDAQNRFGLEGSAALQELLRLYDFLSQNEDLAQQIEGLTQLMHGLWEAGIRNSELWQRMALDVTRLFDEMIARGLDSTTAMILLRAPLQRLWELWREGKIEVDEHTEALLRNAETQGIVGEHARDVNERILEVLVAIARVLGADIPDAFDRAARAGEDSANRIRNAWRDIPGPPGAGRRGRGRGDDSDGGDDSTRGTPPPAARGMRVPYTPGGRDVHIAEAATENILSDEQVAGITARAMAMLGGTTAAGARQAARDIHIHVEVGGQELRHYILRQNEAGFLPLKAT